jgi:hypothetical protein
MENPGAFILLDAPTALEPARISEAFAARHPDVPVVVGGDGQGAVLSAAGLVVTIMYFDDPLPPLWPEALEMAGRYWPEADAVFDRHQAHLMISVVGKGANRLQLARVASAAVGAVIASHRACSGVLWDKTVANSAAMADDFCRSAFAADDVPCPLWVGLEPFQDEGAATFGVVTIGLRQFIGRELELEAPAESWEALLASVGGMATYLLQDGVKVEDGDWFNAPDDENARITMCFRQSKRFKDLPVMAATLPAPRTSH